MAKREDEKPVITSGTDAKGGHNAGRMPYVLGIALVGAILALGVVAIYSWLVG